MMGRFWCSILFLPFTLTALPEGAEVKAGNAAISLSNNAMHVEASDSTIINWNSFSIDPNQVAAFLLPNSQSAILNRVTGENLSSILGKLESNGQIFLINPNGIVIGKEGIIQAAGFIGASLNLSNELFLSKGPLLFAGTESSIVNEGTIIASEGNVFLVGAELTNRGNIQALKGMAALCEGDQVYIHLNKDEPIWFRIQSNELGPLQSEGSIRAKNIELHGVSITHSGILDATGSIEQDGRIYLVANRDLNLDGSITAPGGETRILGKDIILNSSARIDVSDQIGGGTVLIGGDFKGANQEIANASNVFVSAGAEIKADALYSGDGGKVVVWSDDTTIFRGSISAQSTGETGNGGFAEISGKNHLSVSGPADLRSRNGQIGTLYLDPGSVLIKNGPNAAPPVSMDVFNDGYISNQLSMGNLTIDTANSTNGGTQTITINSNVNVSWATTSILTLNAGRDIVFSGGGTFNNTAAGQMIFTANTPVAASYAGVDLNQCTLSTAGGSISITGGGGNNGAGPGIGLLSATLTATGAGTITLTGTGGSGVGSNYGIQFNYGGAGKTPPSTLSVENGNLALTGTAGGTGNNNIGILLSKATFLPTGSGAIHLRGTGAGSLGNLNNDGINFEANTVSLAWGNGEVRIDGIGGPNGESSGGITNLGPGSISSTGGNIIMNGTGQSNPAAGSGVGIFWNGNITSTSGNISLTGIGGGNGNASGYGVNFPTGATVTTAGNIFIQGTGAGDNGTGVTVQNVITTGASSTITIVGIASLLGMMQAHGVLVASSGNVRSIDGNISITGTGASAALFGFGEAIRIIDQATVSCTGTGSIFLESKGFNILSSLGGINSLISTNSGNISILAVNGSSDIYLADCTCGGSFIAAANQSFTQQAGSTLQLTSMTGKCTIIVDQLTPNTLGPGQFINSGTITTTSGDLAIYGVGGPTVPPPGPLLPGVPPNQVTFGNLNPPIADWDMAIAPDFLASKYYTSWDLGGPYHGVGFGSVYTPGTGVFGSNVVWYKFPFPNPPVPPNPPTPSPIPPALAAQVISLVPKVFQQLWVNTQVNENYFFYPYEFCRGFPCIWINERNTCTKPF
ncbi:MAG: filamentous hemagglutinin N-terminal domain-containing protein [Parachlamydiales bacterium]|nr:filamentous hemagglutinin N-terminal domain-containing protein [Parachlamydiales bacterium]